MLSLIGQFLNVYRVQAMGAAALALLGTGLWGGYKARDVVADRAIARCEAGTVALQAAVTGHLAAIEVRDGRIRELEQIVERLEAANREWEQRCGSGAPDRERIRSIMAELEELRGRAPMRATGPCEDQLRALAVSWQGLAREIGGLR